MRHDDDEKNAWCGALAGGWWRTLEEMCTSDKASRASSDTALAGSGIRRMVGVEIMVKVTDIVILRVGVKFRVGGS